jgi:hypothetical protein
MLLDGDDTINQGNDVLRRSCWPPFFIREDSLAAGTRNTIATGKLRSELAVRLKLDLKPAIPAQGAFQ